LIDSHFIKSSDVFNPFGGINTSALRLVARCFSIHTTFFSTLPLTGQRFSGEKNSRNVSEHTRREHVHATAKCHPVRKNKNGKLFDPIGQQAAFVPLILSGSRVRVLTEYNHNGPCQCTRHIVSAVTKAVGQTSTWGFLRGETPKGKTKIKKNKSTQKRIGDALRGREILPGCCDLPIRLCNTMAQTYTITIIQLLYSYGRVLIGYINVNCGERRLYSLNSRSKAKDRALFYRRASGRNAFFAGVRLFRRVQ